MNFFGVVLFELRWVGDYLHCCVVEWVVGIFEDWWERDLDFKCRVKLFRRIAVGIVLWNTNTQTNTPYLSEDGKQYQYSNDTTKKNKTVQNRVNSDKEALNRSLPTDQGVQKISRQTRHSGTASISIKIKIRVAINTGAQRQDIRL